MSRARGAALGTHSTWMRRGDSPIEGVAKMLGMGTPDGTTRGPIEGRCLLAGLLVVIIMVTLAGCQTVSGGMDELRALPEATLTYPASDEVNNGGSDREMTTDGPQSAFTWRWLGVDARSEEIERFYAEQLASLGWADATGASGARNTAELKARAWRKGDVVFRLAFPDPTAFADQAPFSRYTTVYDVRLTEGRNTGASPSL